MQNLDLPESTSESRIFRVGFPPNPWAWSGWEWATDGRFSGRWDDPNGNFRTVYAGSTLLASLLEVLASFRKDARLAAEMEDIAEEAEDRVRYPTSTAGEIPRAWLDARSVTSASLGGRFFDVAGSWSLSYLYPQFIGKALQLGLDDFDAAAIKDSRARPLTQAVAAWVFEDTELDGIAFASRHGDDLSLWAIFERASGSEASPLLAQIEEEDVSHHSYDIVQAFMLLGLKWQEE